MTIGCVPAGIIDFRPNGQHRPPRTSPVQLQLRTSYGDVTKPCGLTRCLAEGSGVGICWGLSPSEVCLRMVLVTM